MTKQLTRYQCETRVKKYEKELNDIKEWFDKKQVQYKKNLGLVQDKGFLTSFNIDEVTEENRFDYSRKVIAEIERAETLNSTKALINKMWTIDNTIGSWVDKKGRLERVGQLVDKYKKEIEERFGELTPEQLKEKEKNKEEKELKASLEKELDNIHIDSLDKWLSDYKKAYIEWVNENITTSWEKALKLSEVDQKVSEQKLTILVKSYPKVGLITDLEFDRMGNDGTFNGTVTGEKGTCSIRTIIAGGYIQRLHYRVLVK